MHMNSKHRKTLEAIFSDPVKADIKWVDIEKLSLLAEELWKRPVAHEFVLNLMVCSPISIARIRNQLQIRVQ